jgi:hypothetical protein
MTPETATFDRILNMLIAVLIGTVIILAIAFSVISVVMHHDWTPAKIFGSLAAVILVAKINTWRERRKPGSVELIPYDRKRRR